MENADLSDISKIGSTYQVVPENSDQIQGYMANYQNLTVGNSDQQLYQ